MRITIVEIRHFADRAVMPSRLWPVGRWQTAIKLTSKNVEEQCQTINNH
jgi:hypothetical protein